MLGNFYCRVWLFHQYQIAVHHCNQHQYQIAVEDEHGWRTKFACFSSVLVASMTANTARETHSDASLEAFLGLAVLRSLARFAWRHGFLFISVW